MKTNSDHSPEFLIPISYGSTEVIETGKWGFQKPQTAFMTAPCQESCPAGNPIPEFLYFATQGRYDEALRILLRENPFPGVCGRVCFHPCEIDCNRSQYDESVSIQAMERFVFDAAFDHLPDNRPGTDTNPSQVAVVGAGPAGLSGAYFLALLGHQVTLFEAQKEPGGVMRWGIPEYRLPRTVLKRETQRIVNLGVEIRTGVKAGDGVSFDELDRFDAIFLSPGAGLSIPLQVEGETLRRVWRGGDFLRQINSGDKIRLGKEVIVIGGGNTAMDVARSALRLGARVTIAYRRTRAQMPAIHEEIAETEEEGARFVFLSQPVRVSLLRRRRLAVTFQRMKLNDADESHRPRPVPVRGKYFTLEADHLITAVGERVDLSWIPRNLTHDGLIDVGPSLGTNHPRIFAGGDAVDQPRTIVTAIAAGKRAAISIDCHLRGWDAMEVFSKVRVGSKGSLSMEAYLSGRKEGKWPDPQGVVSYDRINTLYFEPSKRVHMRKLGLEQRRTGFSEVNGGFSSEEASLAASRCFSCGTCNYCYNCYFFCPEGVISLDPFHQTKYVDLHHCKGCGTCAKACPRNVVEMKEVG